MTPSAKWFPRSLQERAPWFTNFNTNIQTVGASLGLTVPELASIADDAENFSYLAMATVSLDAYSEAFRNYRNTMTEGDIGDPSPVFPANVALAIPHAGVETGIFERLDGYVKRIRVSSVYTDEIGALLGIIPSGSPSIPVGDAPPVITASVDPGNIIEVKFVKGQSGGIYIEVNVDNAGWTFKEKAIKSPAVFDVEANPANTPRGVQVRARFLEGNAPVGNWSDIVTVQTIP